MSENTKLTSLDILQDRITAAIDAHCQTNDITTFEIIGTLEAVKLGVYQNLLEDD